MADIFYHHDKTNSDWLQCLLLEPRGLVSILYLLLLRLHILDVIQCFSAACEGGGHTITHRHHFCEIWDDELIINTQTTFHEWSVWTLQAYLKTWSQQFPRILSLTIWCLTLTSISPVLNFSMRLAATSAHSVPSPSVVHICSAHLALWKSAAGSNCCPNKWRTLSNRRLMSVTCSSLRHRSWHCTYTNVLDNGESRNQVNCLFPLFWGWLYSAFILCEFHRWAPYLHRFYPSLSPLNSSQIPDLLCSCYTYALYTIYWALLVLISVKDQPLGIGWFMMKCVFIVHKLLRGQFFSFNLYKYYVFPSGLQGFHWKFLSMSTALPLSHMFLGLWEFSRSSSCLSEVREVKARHRFLWNYSSVSGLFYWIGEIF